jgi:hypothetical protein
MARTFREATHDFGERHCRVREQGDEEKSAVFVPWAMRSRRCALRIQDGRVGYTKWGCGYVESGLCLGQQTTDGVGRWEEAQRHLSRIGDERAP